MTYVAQFLEKYPDPDLDDDSPKDKVRPVHVVFVVECTYTVYLHCRFLCVFTGAGWCPQYIACRSSFDEHLI